jgi:hypothetical protein
MFQLTKAPSGKRRNANGGGPGSGLSFVVLSWLV